MSRDIVGLTTERLHAAYTAAREHKGTGAIQRVQVRSDVPRARDFRFSLRLQNAMSAAVSKIEGSIFREVAELTIKALKAEVTDILADHERSLASVGQVVRWAEWRITSVFADLRRRSSRRWRLYGRTTAARTASRCASRH